jgi:hypothetical protein
MEPSIRYGRHTPLDPLSTKASAQVNATHAGDGERAEALPVLKPFFELKAWPVLARPCGAAARWPIPGVVVVQFILQFR